MTDLDKGWTGSFPTIGCFLSCLFSGYLVDSIGRKWAIYVFVPVTAFGWLLLAFSVDLAMVFIGRLLTGLGGGLFFIAGPMYTSEIGSKDIRGMLGAYFQLCVNYGLLYVIILGYFWQNEPKKLALSCLLFPCILAVGLFFVPESPMYYLKKGNEEKAVDSMKRVREEGENVQPELEGMKHILQGLPAESKFFQSMRDPAAKKATFIVFVLMFTQQWCGINAVYFYTIDIFKTAGMSDPGIGSIIMCVFQLIATIVSTLLIDRLGRRILIISSCALMATGICFLGIYFIFGTDFKIMSETQMTAWSWLPILAVTVYTIGFAVGIGPIPFMIAPELLPPAVRSTICSLAGAFNWLNAFIITSTFPKLANIIGGGIIFLVFCGISIVAIVFTVFFLIETKGKTLEEIQKELSES